MPRHVIEDDLLLTLDGYVKKSENIPSRVVVTDSKGDIVIKNDLNVSQLDYLRNVTSDIQAQLNSKSELEHLHEEYLTLEELKDINFSGVAQDVVYDPSNANLESTNVKDALDEVDNKIEEYIDKLVADKAELKGDIANTNESIGSVSETVSNMSKTLSNKADKNHTHDGADHTHEDLKADIQTNAEAISNNAKGIGDLNSIVRDIPTNYASKTHLHPELQSQIDTIVTDITDHKHQYLEDAISTVSEQSSDNRADISNIKESITNINTSLGNKASVDHTHEASEHIHQDILDSIGTLNGTINQKISDEVDRADRAYAEKTHEHTGYASSDHTHPSTEHNHDGIYALDFHLHSNYADNEHYHNDLYAELVHNHVGEYAPSSHTHGDLANKEHTHNEFSDFVLRTDRNVANGVAGLDAFSKISLSVLPDTAKALNIIGTHEERLALSTVDTGTIFRETDTGNSYIYDGNAWVILADSNWENVNLSWNNVIDKPNVFTPDVHTHTVSDLSDLDLGEYAEKVHTHKAQEVAFEDGETLQQKLDEGSLGGGSSAGGDCNVVISDTPPVGLPIGGIWVDISNL